MDLAFAGGHHWTGVDRDNPWLVQAQQLADELSPVAADHDRSNEFVAYGCTRARDRGLLTMLLPPEHGGAGASHAEACAALAVVAHGCPATALTLSMHTHLVATQVWAHRQAKPAPLLERVADGAFCVTSIAADWIASNGEARAVGDGFLVSGRKGPCSGCLAGELMVTSARHQAGPDGPEILHFVTPLTTAGISIESTWEAMGMRGTASHTVVLNDVYVDDTAIVLRRPADRWHPMFNTVLGAAVPLIMAVYVGIAEEAARRAIALAAGRVDPIRNAPLVGRMLNRLQSAQDATATAVRLSGDLSFDNTDEHAAAVLSRRTAAVEAVIETTRLALEVAGGHGFSVAGGIERLHRDAHGALYHPLAPADQERWAGRLALGYQPWPGS